MKYIEQDMNILINNIINLPKITATTIQMNKQPLLLKIKSILTEAYRLQAKANKYDNLVKEIEEQCKRDIEQARKEYKITLNDRQDGIREEAQNILELLDKEKEKI